MIDSDLLTTAQAALYLKVSVSWLNHDRAEKKPKIPFLRVGSRLIRYRLVDLESYAAKLHKP